jgi:pyruvate kinase
MPPLDVPEMPTDIARLKQTLDRLILDVEANGKARLESWAGLIHRPGFAASAANLAHYLALPPSRPCARCSVR